MDPISPVFPEVAGSTALEVVYAKEQSQYRELPTFKMDKAVISRWRLTDEERLYLAEGGDLYICQMNFGAPLQPILPMATIPEAAFQVMLEIGS